MNDRIKMERRSISIETIKRQFDHLPGYCQENKNEKYVRDILNITIIYRKK